MPHRLRHTLSGSVCDRRCSSDLSSCDSRSPLASVRRSAPVARIPRSRRSEASARRQVAICSRSLADVPLVPLRSLAASSRRAGSSVFAACCSRRRASSRASARPVESAARARPTLPSASAAAAQSVGFRVTVIAHQHLRDLRRRQRPESQTRTSRSHRRQQCVRQRRHEHEDRCGRHFLERLQERVLRRIDEGVSLVDDHHAPAGLEGRYPARSTTSRTASILIEPVSPGSIRMTSG